MIFLIMVNGVRKYGLFRRKSSDFYNNMEISLKYTGTLYRHDRGYPINGCSVVVYPGNRKYDGLVTGKQKI